VKGIHLIVGISCEGFEEELMALFTAIEVNHSQKELASCSNLVNKDSRELKRLSYSINYDMKGSSASRGRGKGRALIDS
jgi:hypothetical protein